MLFEKRKPKFWVEMFFTFKFVSSIIIHVNFMNPVNLKAFNISKMYFSFEDKSIK